MSATANASTNTKAATDSKATATATTKTSVTAAGVTLAAGFDGTGQYSVYVAEKAGQALVKKLVPHSLPADDEVVVRIHASGICASDVDATAGKFPPFFTFPMVAGHEGVGTVVAAGKLVKAVKVGSRVGVGVYRDACGGCVECHTGHTNLCAGAAVTFAGGAQGTFGEYIRIKAQFAVPIPDAVEDLEAVGPLFCAGATVYAPFVNHKIQGGDRVAVIGVGGLGHLALKIARAWGCDVTALSRDASKRDSILALGAHHFVDTKADPELKSVAGRFDYILFCNSGSDVNWKAMVSALRPNGTVVLLGTSGFADVAVDPVPLIFGQKKIAGSAAGSVGVYHQMVAFCAQHKILPQNERFAFDDINAAFARVRDGSLRFRAVVSFGLNKSAAAGAATTTTAAAATTATTATTATAAAATKK